MYFISGIPGGAFTKPLCNFGAVELASEIEMEMCDPNSRLKAGTPHGHAAEHR